MGLLALGTPLDWDQAKPLANHVRKHGIDQFLSLWNKIKDRRGDVLLWGDEIEYIVVSMDSETKNAKLSLRQGEILAELESSRQKATKENPNLESEIPTFHPEYGRFMLESTPGLPYGVNPKELNKVESNMRIRRKIAKSHLKANEIPLTITNFPRLGCNDFPFTEPHYEPNGKASQSLFLPDELINQHVRFPTLTANIRQRRGSKVAINMPIYKDSKTPSPFVDPTIPRERNLFPGDSEAKDGAALDDHIYMDAMGFGMGCCCLQVTFQACSVSEARIVYDQLVPLAPIFLALTASSPIYRGFLSDVDARWNVISSAVDDRTEEERGLKELKNSRMRMSKSRYDSVSSYISKDPLFRRVYNDLDLAMDSEIRQKLLNHGIDEQLSNHLSHLFIRDPLVIFSENVDQDDENSMDHFENIQSTNWQTIRFKPPPPGGNIGWRVEFRSMEVQITDFENAAFSVFIVLVTRAILSFGLNFYIPISKVDANMKRAHVRDALSNQKYFFRKEVFRTKPRHPHSRGTSRSTEFQPASSETRRSGTPYGSRSSSPNRFTERRRETSSNGNSSGIPVSPCSPAFKDSRSNSPDLGPVEDEFSEFSINEIINGTSSSSSSTTTTATNTNGSETPSSSSSTSFIGLIPLINNYLDSLNVDIETRCELNLYLDLVSKRASGELMTTAKWIREFVRNHRDYHFDSVVSKEINFDLIQELDRIQNGTKDAHGFLPEGYAKRQRAFDEAKK